MTVRTRNDGVQMAGPHGELWWERLCVVLLRRMGNHDVEIPDMITDKEWQEAANIKVGSELMVQEGTLMPLMKLSLRKAE